MAEANILTNDSSTEKIVSYFNVLASSTSSYLFVTDLATNRVTVSQNLVDDFELPGQSFIDMDSRWKPLIHPDDLALFIMSMADTQQSGRHDICYRIKDRSGKYVWLHCRGSFVRKENGEPYIFAGAMVKMTKSNEADAITGLLNKYQFETDLSKAHQKSVALNRSGVVIILGVDNFRLVNESYNRYFGNKVLRSIGRQIENLLPSTLTLYKLDSDEFGVVWPGATIQMVDNFYSSVQRCMNRIQQLDGQSYFCTISAGTAFFSVRAEEFLQVLKHAEVALDTSKKNGKNMNTYFTQDEADKWLRSVSLRESLRYSIEHGFTGFLLHYQPQVSANGNRLIGAEALLRWRDPEGHLVPPVEFIPVLEESRLIVPVGQWVVREALNICRKWRQQIPDFRVSVNVSYCQIKDDDFGTFIRRAVKESGLDPKALTLELTESLIVSDWNYLNKQFDDFRNNGINIAMDDFGTGYSSLAYLKNLSCDTVKIDKAFVEHILTSDFDKQLIIYTVELCHQIGINICVEGVECMDEYNVLTKECNVDYVQGYLFGRPVDESEFESQFMTGRPLAAVAEV